MAASLAKVRLPSSVMDKINRVTSLSCCGVKVDNKSDVEATDEKGMTMKMRTTAHRIKKHLMRRMGLHHRRALTWTDMDAAAMVTGVEFAEIDANGFVVIQQCGKQCSARWYDCHSLLLLFYYHTGF